MTVCDLIIFLQKCRIIRIVFKTDNYECTLFKRSPYVDESKLGKQLPKDSINIPDMYPFKTRLKRLNETYVDLLP